MKPAQVLYDTLGLSGRYQANGLERLLAVGDAGYFLKGIGADGRIKAMPAAPRATTVSSPARHRPLASGARISSSAPAPGLLRRQRPRRPQRPAPDQLSVSLS